MAEKLHAFGIEGSQEQQEAYTKLRHVYEMVYDHPFVTSESRLRRTELQRNLKERARNNQHESPIALVFGSVARGQAYHGSDVDYSLLIPDMNLNNMTIMSMLGIPFRTSIPHNRSQMIPEEIRTMRGFSLLYRLVFYPALQEFPDDQHDLRVVEAMFSIRRKMIQAIATTWPGSTNTAEEVWESIRDVLNARFLPNLTTRRPIYDNWDTKDRVGILDNYRRTQIMINGSRAKEFFDELDDLSFPDWEMMMNAFGVEES